MFIYCSSTDSQLFYPGNVATLFKVKLPKTLHFEGGGWQVGLVEIQIPSFIKTYDAQFLTVNSTLCQDSIVGQELLPCLRRIFKSDLQGTNQPFNPILYTALNVIKCDVITVYIKDEKGNPPLLDPTKALDCTLHFRQLRH